MRQLRAEIEIAAPPERVWEVLFDFDAYPEWNPFIRRISGSPREGEKLEVRILGSLVFADDVSPALALAVLESPKVGDAEVERFASQKNVLEAVLRGIPMKRRFARSS